MKPNEYITGKIDASGKVMQSVIKHRTEIEKAVKELGLLGMPLEEARDFIAKQIDFAENAWKNFTLY